MQICALKIAPAVGIAGKGDAAGVGRPARRERDRVQRSKFVLIGAVVIHGPDLFVAAARADVGDLRAGDAGTPPESRAIISSANWCANCAGSLVVRMRRDRRGRSRRARMYSARRKTTPGFPRVSGRGEVAEGQELRRDRGAAPDRVVQFGRGAGHLSRIEALAGDVDNSAVVQVVAHDVAE